MADVKLTHVPYRGTGAMQGDLVGGHVAMSITTLPSVIAAVRGGLLRAVAVTDSVRSPMLPELPTIAEAGVPGYTAVIHYGMVTTAGTDPTIVKRLNAELQTALASEEVRVRIAEEGGAPLPGSPGDQGRDIDAEETKWGALIRKLGLKAE
jgi:tripartite-type tricarboxylate transporter receptor subunit TctC